MAPNPSATGRAGFPSRALAPGGPRAWWAWALAVAFVVYLAGYQAGYSVVTANVRNEVGLSIAQVGAMAATYTWAFAAGQFLGGALLDRLGARRILPGSIALVSLGIFVFANAQTYGSLVLSQLMIAIGSCTGFVGAGYLGGHWFGMANFGVMFGLVQTAAALASTFSVNLAAMALGQGDWRTLFNGLALAGLVLLLPGLFYLRNPTPVAGVQGGLGNFFGAVLRHLGEVARSDHVWLASLQGALCFGVVLALGLAWLPGLLQVHGMPEGSAGFGASLLWFGLAAGSAVIPAWSDRIRRRKPPILLGLSVLLAALAALVYLPAIPAPVALACCFIAGFAGASHMIAFSTAADVVQPYQIGTCTAIVSGVMFTFGALLISRPGLGRGFGSGLPPVSSDLAQFASRPLVLGVLAALLVAALMRETYPTRQAH